MHITEILGVTERLQSYHSIAHGSNFISFRYNRGENLWFLNGTPAGGIGNLR